MSPQVAQAIQAGNLAGRAGELYPRPILLLHGDQDPTVPVDGARRLHQALQVAYQTQPERALLREVAGAGHEFSPHMAEEAVGFLRQFLL
jgi:predicted esterase